MVVLGLGKIWTKWVPLTATIKYIIFRQLNLLRDLLKDYRQRKECGELFVRLLNCFSLSSPLLFLLVNPAGWQNEIFD